MSELSSGELKNGLDLDEHAISELIEFFMLLDKWDRETKQEPKAIPETAADQQLDLDMP